MRPPIVCGVDGSRDSHVAARVARALARRIDLPLDLVHVSGAAQEAADMKRARAIRGELGEDLASGVVMRVETGSTVERLIEASRRATLLVIATHGESALRQTLTGSVSTAVTRRAASPVLLVPPGATRDGVAPLGDGGVVCGIRDDRDVACAATAAWWADDLGVTLTLAHVLPGPKLPLGPAGGAPPPGLVHRAADDVAAARGLLEEIADAISSTGCDCRTLVVNGHVGPALARLADDDDAVLIALGASRHGVLTRALTGSPSRHLLRRGARPVMVCPRPEAVLGSALRAACQADDGGRLTGGPSATDEP
jgi:nucleotide-binding universal stress UspA family protein